MDKKKKVIYISILGILLFIGGSFAVWILNFSQTNSNVISQLVLVFPILTKMIFI